MFNVDSMNSIFLPLDHASNLTFSNNEHLTSMNKLYCIIECQNILIIAVIVSCLSDRQYKL